MKKQKAALYMLLCSLSATAQASEPLAEQEKVKNWLFTRSGFMSLRAGVVGCVEQQNNETDQNPDYSGSLQFYAGW
jgi:hypothetical protein